MSLINKMLQDLDARGSAHRPALRDDIKPVLVNDGALTRRKVVIGSALALGIVAVGLAFWLRKPVPGAAPVAVLVPAQGNSPAALPGSVPAVGVSVVPLTPAAAPAMMPVPVPVAVPAPVVAAAPALPSYRPVGPGDPTAPPLAGRPLSQSGPASPGQGETARIARQRRDGAVTTGDDVAITRSAAAPPFAGNGRQMTPAQQADSQYRRALGAIEEGRIPTAFEHLEESLKLNPRNEAARQSLVGLLIESGRKDEAVRQLEQGLSLDAGQMALAMLLARIQIERGGSGVATLQRSLPAADNNGDYRAFLAGALQRDGRHREAVDQYNAALRTAPDNAVWLMGMGISLQADRRNADALAAFRAASVSGSLTAPLQSFVDGKIESLSPR